MKRKWSRCATNEDGLNVGALKDLGPRELDRQELILVNLFKDVEIFIVDPLYRH